MSTVTVVPTVEAGNVPPRVRLDVTDTGSSPALFAATVNRLDPDGTSVPVRTADGNPLVLTTSGANRVGLLYDYEVPFGQPVSYSTLESPAVVSAEVAVDESRVWLVHPGVPELSMTVTVASLGSRSAKVTRGVFYPMGRSAPVVQTDGARKSAEYTLSLLTMTLDERAGLENLLADTGVLLLNVPAAKGWGLTSEYVAVGDLTEGRVSRFVGDPMRTWELPCTVVDRPAGGSQAQRTLVDLLAFPTLESIRVAYPTLAAVLAGP